MGASLQSFETLIAQGVRAAYVPQPGPQLALLSCPIQDVLFGGARGGGKTFALLGDFLAHQERYGSGAKGILFRRTYDELDEVKAQAQEIYPLVGAVWRAGSNTWIFPNGARLKLRYLRRDEDASHYQGHQYTWVGIDEAGNFPSPDPIDKIKATLRSKTGVPTYLRMTANPGGPGHAWLKARYIDPAPAMTPHQCPITGAWRVFIPSRLSDNRILSEADPTYEQRIRGSGPSWLVQGWLNGDWNATPEGGLIKAAWFRRYSVAPVYFRRIIQSWDTGIKDGDTNDPSVCTTWGESHDGYYLLDVWRDRTEYPGLKRAVQSLAKLYMPSAVLIEDKGSGQSLIQDLRTSTRLPVIAIEPKGNKVDRLVGVSGMIEAGLVHLPEVAPWLLDYELELTIFPLAAHDDQVDSTSQFLAWINQNAGMIDHASAGQRAITAGTHSIDQSVGYGRVRRHDD